MLYAISLDEMLIAVLSLLGGFLTPVLVSTGENKPIALFCYVLILGVGAILCAYYRKWRVVNLVAFVGTFLLYVGWFEKFYRPTMRHSEGMPEQMSIALSWLGVFFTIYLVLPMLYGLVKKIKAQREDVLLVVSNAAVTFVYLWQMLYGRYRLALAFCAIGLCVAHLVLMTLVARRCREDVGSRLSLLVVGLFFLTIAVPLYLKMYGVAMAWAAEGVVLTVIGRRYRSVLTQIGASAALLLGVGKLVYHLPMHTGAFTLVFNPAFGTWCFVVGAFAVCHVIYRRASNLEEILRDMLSQILYAATMLLLMSAMAMEWHWHCRYNITSNPAGRAYFIEGVIVLFTVSMLLFVFRPICPRGILVRWIAVILGLVGSLFLLVSFTEVYTSGFMVFANIEFVIALLFVSGLFGAAWLLKNVITEGEYNHIFVVFFALLGIVVLWVLLSEEIHLYWYCRNRYVGAVMNWRFLAGMYISVMWAIYGAAIMAVGFWRRIVMLRYIAMGLFALLLGKVFVLDMRTVKSVYRIAAFMATGITLVGVSYLYQHLKKKGFFEAMAIEKDADN